jgi:hypothetical protein
MSFRGAEGDEQFLRQFLIGESPSDAGQDLFFSFGDGVEGFLGGPLFTRCEGVDQSCGD